MSNCLSFNSIAGKSSLLFNIIPKILYPVFDKLQNLHRTYLINPTAATCSVGWALMHGDVAIAGCSPATHDVCGNAPAQITECISFNQVAKGERSFFIP